MPAFPAKCPEVKILQCFSIKHSSAFGNKWAMTFSLALQMARTIPPQYHLITLDLSWNLPGPQSCWISAPCCQLAWSCTSMPSLLYPIGSQAATEIPSPQIIRGGRKSFIPSVCFRHENIWAQSGECGLLRSPTLGQNPSEANPEI